MQTADADALQGIRRWSAHILFPLSLYQAGRYLAACGACVAFNCGAGTVLANRGLVFYPWLVLPAAPPVCLVGLALFALLPLLVQGKEWLSCDGPG